MGSGGGTKRDRGKIRNPRPKHITTINDGANIRVADQGGNGSRVQPIQGSQCRIFGLVRPTGVALSAKAGMHIWGDFNDPKVTIVSNAGELGDAPSQVARFFITGRDNGDGGSLRGTILKSTPREVRVKLCLN
ncbi:MAG: hypothetical protein DMF72_10345 [Acidobacteria bacterium]|nr:MAG: hypothetical protein DMF72_10345 [Acidobacteriota bacterium]